MAQELWPLITKCVDNVVAGRSVPSSLELLRRAIATLPAHEAKSWFGGSRTKENRYKYHRHATEGGLYRALC